MQKGLLQGDKVLWAHLALLALFSFFPIFSASSNLSYVIGAGSPWQYLLKHTFILITGFLLSGCVGETLFTIGPVQYKQSDLITTPYKIYNITKPKKEKTNE